MESFDEVKKEIREKEGDIITVEFGPYSMLPSGSFGDTEGFFTLTPTQEGLGILAKACKIPSSYLRNLPPDLQAENINYGVYAHSVREKYNLVVKDHNLVGLTKKDTEITTNKELVETLESSLLSLGLDNPEVINREIGTSRSMYIVKLTGTEVGVGIALEIFPMTSNPTLMIPCIIEKKTGIISLHPSAGNMEGSCKEPIMKNFILTRVIDQSKMLIEGFDRMKTTGIDNKFGSLEGALSSLKVGKSLSKFIMKKSLNGLLLTVYDLYLFLQRGDNSESLLSRKTTNTICGKIISRMTGNA